jgi:Cu/Ag efflux protein CusF
MRLQIGVCFVLLAGLLGCGKPADQAGKKAEKRYEMRGEVIRVDEANQTANIKHEKIADWMDAMTMDFPIQPKEEFKKFKAGDRITGTVVVKDMDYYLTDIRVAQP